MYESNRRLFSLPVYRPLLPFVYRNLDGMLYLKVCSLVVRVSRCSHVPPCSDCYLLTLPTDLGTDAETDKRPDRSPQRGPLSSAQNKKACSEPQPATFPTLISGHFSNSRSPKTTLRIPDLIIPSRHLVPISVDLDPLSSETYAT
jgi:hypothetical protein